MTGKRRRISISAALQSLGSSSLNMELKKSSVGAVAVLTGIVSVSEYSDESIVLLTHSGRVSIYGESLSISALEGRILEIYGRITEVRLGYGKA